MPLYQPVLYTLLQLVILSGIGFVLRRYLKWPGEFFQRLSKLLVTYALPLYLFTKIARSEPHELLSASLFPLYALILLAISFAVAFPFLTFTGFRGVPRRAGSALATFGNASYLPLTVIAIFQLTAPTLAERLGGGAPQLYVGAFVLGFSPLFWTAGNLMLTQQGGRVRPLQFVTPPFMGVAAGFIAALSGGGTFLSEKGSLLFPIYRSLEMLGNVTFPMILITVGAMVADLRFGSNVKREMVGMATVVASVRFLLLPALFVAAYFLFLRRAGLNEGQQWVLFLEVSAPPATNFSVMAGNAQVNTHSTAFTLLVTYAVYLLILPFELLVFLSLPGILPAGAI